MSRVIVVVDKGSVINAFSDDKDLRVDVLDYDNMRECVRAENEGEFDYYAHLAMEIPSLYFVY